MRPISPSRIGRHARHLNTANVTWTHRGRTAIVDHGRDKRCHVKPEPGVLRDERCRGGIGGDSRDRGGSDRSGREPRWRQPVRVGPHVEDPAGRGLWPGSRGDGDVGLIRLRRPVTGGRSTGRKAAGAPLLPPPRPVAAPTPARDRFHRTTAISAPPATTSAAPTTTRAPTRSERRRRSAENTTPKSDSVATIGATTDTVPR